MNKQSFTIILSLFTLTGFLSGCQSPQQQRPVAFQAFEHTRLPGYSSQQLEKDFNLLVSSLKEGHTGLYAYTSQAQFDSLINARRQLLRDGLNGLAFYNIVAPLVAATREDHCDIHLSEEVKKYMVSDGLFLPLVVINLQEKTYILNDSADGTPLKGFELLAVNDLDIKAIKERLFASFGADGYILTSKYRYLDFRGLAHEYAKVIDQQKESTIIVLNPVTQKRKHINYTPFLQVHWQLYIPLYSKPILSGRKLTGQPSCSLCLIILPYFHSGPLPIVSTVNTKWISGSLSIHRFG